MGGYVFYGGYGISFYIKGLVFDWIVGVIVVFVNLIIVNCFKMENLDLFWVICGVGFFMGVVIEFKFDIFEVFEKVIYFIVLV